VSKNGIFAGLEPKDFLAKRQYINEKQYYSATEKSVKARAKREVKEDRRLARGLLQGRLRAWEKLYTVYAEPLYRFTLARLDGDTEAAAETVQETIVRAVEHIWTFEPDKGSLWSWLCGIAMNKIREGRRNAAKTAKLRERMQDVNRCHGRAPSDGDETSNVKLVLSGLSPCHQEVLIHKYLQGQSMRDVAEAMGISEKAVESRLTRAREAFRNEYAKLSAAAEVIQDG
jgi:RNA polymerase sigma-70 factor (ECF subfamily)